MAIEALMAGEVKETRSYRLKVQLMLSFSWQSTLTQELDTNPSIWSSRVFPTRSVSLHH
jgi:hypothetical protein